MSFFEFVVSLPPVVLIIYFFVTGSIFGSFANVLIYRTLRMIQKEEEREGKSSSSEEKDSGDSQPSAHFLSHSSLSENDLSDQASNEQDAISSENLEQLPGSDDSSEFPSMDLKDRFLDRITQHIQFFYCLFVFCVKKPFLFIYRRALFFVKTLRKFNQAQDRESFRSFSYPLFVFRIKNLLKAILLACRITINDDRTKISSFSEKKKEIVTGVDCTDKVYPEGEEEFLFLDLMGHSRCPHCNYKIPFYLNIPILSWFFLRGHCRNCQGQISFRYPLVEFLMACLFSGLFVLIGWKWFFLETLIFVFGLVVVSFIDWERMILPSFFTLPGIYIGLVGGFLNPERAFSSAVIGWLLGGFVLWLSGYLYFKLRKQEGMGDGDVSLMGWIGSVLGWQSIFFILICSCFFGVLIGVWSILQNEQDARTPFPFGPCLAIGAVCYISLLFLVPDILQIFSPLSSFGV